MVERQLHAEIVAHLGHALGVTPGGGHGLLAMDGLHAGFRRSDSHFSVQVHPCADADYVQSFVGTHLLVVTVQFRPKILCKGITVCLIYVCASHYLALLGQLRVGSAMLPCHGVAQRSLAFSVIAATDHSYPVLAHTVLLV